VGRRLVPVALLGLTLTLSPSAGSSLTPPILGAQRVLVVLPTWGPEPFTRDEVQHVVFDDADAFYREASYGKAWLTGTVTPWLKAFDGPIGCSIPLIRTAGAAAAKAAGYDSAAYERIIYVHPSVDCPWSGVTQANTIFLDGTLSRKLVAHELGHAFGLPHANSTSCRRAGCPAVEYGDPYDTMGEGTGDFSAYAKFSLGWLTRIARPAAGGVYQLDPIERPSSRLQAFVVTTAHDQYWIEDRAVRPRTDRGDSPGGTGLIVRVSPSPDLDRSSVNALVNVLVADPAGRKRPELLPGDRFRRSGAFSLTVLKSTGSRARLRFKWTDSVAPRRPRFTAGVVAGKLRVTLENGWDSGSGLARFRVVVDAQRPQQLAGDATEEPVVVGKPLPGTHRVTVVAIDRAGSRSAPAIRQVRVQ
jgi:Gametolysin peptidase M11